MLFNISEPNAPVVSRERAIGIDLGTTYSIACVSDGQKPVCISVEGNTLVPSIAVGKQGSIHSFKRFMTTPSQPVFEGKTPVELSAQVLGRLKVAAEKHLGAPVSKAVITVPAYFDDTARQATKDAAKLAGLQVLRLINEPTAAALAYGLDKNMEGTYAIYDLGGGTFDISILKMTQGVFQVLATGGHLTLGGNDVDQVIADFWCQQSGLKPTPALLALARAAKELSNFQGIFDGVSVQLTEKELETLCAPLVQETLNICTRVLKDATLNANHIQGVVLVGGSTRLRAVQKAVADFFKQPPLTNLDPDRVVAMGAALQAESLTYGGGALLIDVAPLSLGLETMGGLVEKIIPRNSPLPIAMAQEFTTYEDGQTGMSIHVVQGERELVSDCRSLAQFTLNGIPPLPAGAARILVTFQVDADGLLTVSAQEKYTQVRQEISVQPTYGLTAEDFERMVFESQAYGAEDMHQRLLTEYTVEARQILRYVDNALMADADLLTDHEQATLRQAMETLENAITSQNREAIHTQTKNLSTLSQPFAEARLNRAIQQQVLGKDIVR
jgi:molecular chaperone HscA